MYNNNRWVSLITWSNKQLLCSGFLLSFVGFIAFFVQAAAILLLLEILDSCETLDFKLHLIPILKVGTWRTDIV